MTGRADDAVRVGLMSDTHGLFRPSIGAVFAGVNLIVHAGDVGAAVVLDQLSSIAPTEAVFGNVDDARNPALAPSRTIPVGGLTLHVSHGHEFGSPNPAEAGIRLRRGYHRVRPHAPGDYRQRAPRRTPRAGGQPWRRRSATIRPASERRDSDSGRRKSRGRDRGNRMITHARSTTRALAAALTVVLTVEALPQAQSALHPTAELLRELIRIDTSNPPGTRRQDRRVARPRSSSRSASRSTSSRRPIAGKSHFIARLRGDGSRQPVLLAAHARYRRGRAREVDGRSVRRPCSRTVTSCGRGAIDFKGGLAVFARAVMMLAENKVPLARDVIFLSEADEEGRPTTPRGSPERTGPRSNASSRSTRAAGSSRATMAG